MHVLVEWLVHACKTRLGRGDMNIAEFTKLEWKCAAETYSAEFTQLFENDTSLEE